MNHVTLAWKIVSFPESSHSQKVYMFYKKTPLSFCAHKNNSISSLVNKTVKHKILFPTEKGKIQWINDGIY